MTWTKTPEEYPDLLFDLTDAAYRLHHAATSYANRLLLDGRIPKGRLVAVPVPEATRSLTVVAELIGAGLWTDDGKAWVLTDFLLYQPTAAEIEARREYDAIRQKKSRAGDAGRDALVEEERAARDRLNAARLEHQERLSHRDSQRESQRPEPTRPVPSRDGYGEESLSRARARERGSAPVALIPEGTAGSGSFALVSLEEATATARRMRLGAQALQRLYRGEGRTLTTSNAQAAVQAASEVIA